MNQRTTAGYEGYARSLTPAGAENRPLVAPCGRAFEIVYNESTQPLDPSSVFSCLYHYGLDMQQAAGRSCHIDALGKGGHPSVLGSYLVACVLYGTIFDRHPIGLDWRPFGMSLDDRELMQKVATLAVFGS